MHLHINLKTLHDNLLLIEQNLEKHERDEVEDDDKDKDEDKDEDEKSSRSTISSVTDSESCSSNDAFI